MIEMRVGNLRALPFDFIRITFHCPLIEGALLATAKEVTPNNNVNVMIASMLFLNGFFLVVLQNRDSVFRLFIV